MRNTQAPVSSVLDYAWDAGAFTASSAMDATGLSRSTVIAQCEDLARRGWLERLEDSRAAAEGYRAGRPALRFVLRAKAGHIVGLDAGQHRLHGLVTDLRGNVLHREGEDLGTDGDSPQQRRSRIIQCQRRLAERVGSHCGPLLASVIGVPAPVDPDGLTPPGLNPYWDVMNPDLMGCVLGRIGRVENDANLAALAEHRFGAAQGTRSSVTLLSGERFGAGIIIDGRLLRGARGAAGEMHALKLVAGVGNTHGIAASARDLLRNARKRRRVPRESGLFGLRAEDITTETVFLAAADGDPFAIDILEEVAQRLARVATVLGSILDTERIVVGGAMAPHLDSMLESTRRAMREIAPTTPPALVASPFGAEAVAWGAIAQGSVLIRDAVARGELSLG